MTKKRWIHLFLFVAIAAAALVCAFYFDGQVQHWIAHHQSRTAKIFMRNVSRWGDWPAHVALGVILALIAYWRGNKKWTRVFVTMLVACALAGASARIIKITTGRARPSVRSESVWNGPRFSSKYHAFPSGHTAASTAFLRHAPFRQLAPRTCLSADTASDRGFAHVCRRALFFRCSLRCDSRNHVRIPCDEVALSQREIVGSNSSNHVDVRYFPLEKRLTSNV